MSTLEEMTDAELWAVYYEAQDRLQNPDVQDANQRVEAARMNHAAYILHQRGYET